MSVVSLLLEWRGKRQGQSCGYTGASPTRVRERSIAVPTSYNYKLCMNREGGRRKWYGRLPPLNVADELSTAPGPPLVIDRPVPGAVYNSALVWIRRWTLTGRRHQSAKVEDTRIFTGKPEGPQDEY
jgi:hypothetical protein